MRKLNIVNGNILDYLDNKDLIVNSANQYMICGSGVCGAIYKSANKKLLEEYCKSNFKENMKVNEVRITPGFDLGIDILHIYCPKSYKSKKPLKELLYSYNKIFVEAKNKGYKNIISVSLGTGIHGYKHNDIAKDIMIRLNELIKEYDIDFTLVLPNEEIKELYYFDEIDLYIDMYLDRISNADDSIHPKIVGHSKVTNEERKRAKEKVKITKELQKKNTASYMEIKKKLHSKNDK